MWRCTQAEVDPVQLVSSSASQRQTKIADNLVLADPLKNKRRATVETSRLARKSGRAAIPTHRRKANAHQLIRCFAAMSPDSAHLTRRTQITFAHRGSPVTRSCVTPA